jgi:hypothetical protein
VSILPYGGGLAGCEGPEHIVSSPKEGQGQLNVTIRASTGARIRVWREADLFHARPADSAADAEICVAVDLFEVIAELAGLNLEDGRQSAEATRLATEAQQQLRHNHGASGNGSDAE